MKKDNYVIKRTNRECVLQENQRVIAYWNPQERKYEIKNTIKGEEFEIPVAKLYHPMARYFASPNFFTHFLCLHRINKWKKAYMDTLTGSKLRWREDSYGLQLTHSGTKYYFQYRKEDFLRFQSFLKLYGVKKGK